MREKVSAEGRVREIRRKARKKYSSEEKVRIVFTLWSLMPSALNRATDPVS